MRSISNKSFFYYTDAQKNRCLQLKATKETLAHEIEAICAAWPASQPIQNGARCLKSHGITIEPLGTGL